jgi:hypothetical protein
MMNWRHLEGSHGLIQGISQYSSGKTMENHEKPQSGQLVFQPKFKLSISQIQDKSITNTPTHSILLMLNGWYIQ